jgi:hypothetical protein
MQWFQGKISQIEIDSHSDGYLLVERVSRSSNEWSNLLLTKNCSKLQWELGWNGNRLSNGRGSTELLAHDPFIHRWVLDVLKQAERLNK